MCFQNIAYKYFLNSFLGEICITTPSRRNAKVCYLNRAKEKIYVLYWINIKFMFLCLLDQNVCEKTIFCKAVLWISEPGAPDSFQNVSIQFSILESRHKNHISRSINYI